MIKKLLPFVYSFFLCCSLNMVAQNTVGLLSYDPAQTFDGYNLIYPHNQPNVYLLDNCGEIVHVWEDDADFRPGNTAYILENGNIVKTKRPSTVIDDPIWAGGGGATVEIRDWDNNLLWDFSMNDAENRLHHDIAVKPNGNILMIVWEYKSEAESIQAGRDTALLSQDALWPDKIIEVDPSTDNIVWEWNVWDHLIQDFDATKDNYGVVADHPEKVNLNWDTNDARADWMHSNALDYNPNNQQIMLSVPTFHEFWIIDQSTTTAQAAGSTGGLGGRGGDLLYRWGNPAAFDQGTEEDQQLFYQHDTHWATQFLDDSHPNYDKIVLFNNRVGEDFSTANILTPSFDMYDWSYTFNQPADFDWTFTHPEPTKMYSTGLSSVQLLPNGNTLICVGRFGYSFEVNPDGDIVWEYKTPRNGTNAASQGDTLEVNNNLTFRMTRYPATYAAFDGQDLNPIGYLELNPNEEFCDEILPTNNLYKDYKLSLYPNPTDKMVTIEWEGGVYVDIEVFDLLGRQIEMMELSGGRKYLDTSTWDEGVYFVRINQQQVRKLVINR